MLTRFSAIDQKRKAEARALATSDHDGDPIAGPSNWAADKGPGKRVHAELSTLPEDQEIDMDADSAINGTTSKKGRPSPPESGEELPSTSKRGGKPKSNGGRGGKARAAPPVDDDGDETPLRRSSRNAQKAARLL
ncbi:hypothetical protein MPER_05251 [Moniliophthora perniciosa FA553]|nr:hypothetical protein MPER_05251 [Moniliophthora perniciosa FA553]